MIIDILQKELIHNKELAWRLGLYARIQ
jgi:hypothetical protein